MSLPFPHFPFLFLGPGPSLTLILYTGSPSNLSKQEGELKREALA